MRSYTSLALGFVAVLAAACSSSDDSSTSVPPEYSGGPLETPGSNGAGAPPATQPVDTTPDPVAPAAPTAPAPASNEGAPDVTGLEPSAPPPSSNGEQIPVNSANEEPEPPAEQPPAEQPPPAAAQTQVFILFGQSNMFGVPAPEVQDLEITERAEVLTLQACGRHGTNQWMPAQPPLHGCVGQPSNSDFGPGLGPGDYFAKVVTEAFPNDTILLVPNAIAAVSIDVFQPGQQAYNSMVSRARMAQERGEIRGILFHQGETNTGDPAWVGNVARVVTSLRSDLGLSEAIPFIAGELPYDGCCGSGHNPRVNELPGSIPNAFIVSAQGLSTYVERSGGSAGQRLHFDVASQRELGRRYADVFLEVSDGQ